MAKLWSATEDIHSVSEMDNIPWIKNNNADFPIESPSEQIEEGDADLSVMENASQIGLEQLLVVQSVQDGMKTNPVCSAAYMTSLENYHGVLKAMAGNMGVARMIPSMEDFTNQYRANASHQIAAEGLSDFARKMWEKIKEFFRNFFKKSMLLLKRLVKANLELEDYDKYIDAMMGKLKSKPSAAKPTDLEPFNSKLPQLLADEGAEAMDPEYLINYGIRKIDKLLAILANVGFSKIGNLNERDGLPKFADDLINFSRKYKNVGNISVDELEADSIRLQQQAHALLVSIFPHVVTSVKELPEDVYSAVMDNFDRGMMDSGTFCIRSLAEHNAGKDSLPKDANLFMADCGYSNVLIHGHVRTATYTRPAISAPANFSGLVRLYDHYRNTVKKINVRDGDRTIDKTNDAVEKILNTISKEFTLILRGMDTMRPRSYNEESVARMLREGLSKGVNRKEVMDLLSEYFGGVPISFVSDLGREIEVFTNENPFSDSDTFENLAKTRFVPMVKMFLENNGKSFSEFAADLASKIYGADGPALSESDAEKARQILQDLMRNLTTFFTRLQTLLRFVMTNLYGTYTEVRYEYVRYLYMSAQRYRLA